MQFALSNGQPIQASKDALAGKTFKPTCLYCGEWVDLSTAPGLTAPAWFHRNDTAAILCSRERAKAQAELYQAIGVELSPRGTGGAL